MRALLFVLLAPVLVLLWAILPPKVFRWIVGIVFLTANAAILWLVIHR